MKGKQKLLNKKVEREITIVFKEGVNLDNETPKTTQPKKKRNVQAKN